LGFDFGLRRIGVAVGQTITETATPLETLISRDDEPDWGAVDRLVAQWKPDRLVLGMPSNPDGSRHSLARPIARFRRALEQRYALPVELVDENLSSSEASGLLREQRRRGGRRRVRKTDVDRVSAAILLERWMSTGDQR
jgi:putative Holliday junction resolvase